MTNLRVFLFHMYGLVKQLIKYAVNEPCGLTRKKKVSTRPECVIRIYRILSTVDIQVGLLRLFFLGLEDEIHI